jgi:hypothetical protein
VSASFVEFSTPHSGSAALYIASMGNPLPPSDLPVEIATKHAPQNG